MDDADVGSSTSAASASHQSHGFRIRGVAEWCGGGAVAQGGWTLEHRKKLLELMYRKDCNLYLLLPQRGAGGGGRKGVSTENQEGWVKEVGELIAFSKAKKVDVNVGFVLDVNERNKKEQAKKEAETLAPLAELVGVLSEKGCRHFSLFFEPFSLPSTATTTTTTTPTTSTTPSEASVASVQATLANNLLAEVKKTLAAAHKDKEFSNQRWYLHTKPLFATPKPKKPQALAATPQHQPPPQEHKRVMDYWRELDKSLEDKFFLLFDGFSVSPSDEGVDRNSDETILQLWQPPQLSQQSQQQRRHKLVVLEGFPANSIPPDVYHASSTARSPASTIPNLHPYNGRQPALEKSVEGLLLKFDSRKLAPCSSLVPLCTAFDFLRFPYAYNPSISLTAALVDLFEDDRAAEDMTQLISLAPLVSPEGKVVPFEGDPIKMKKLSTESFFTGVSSKIALARKDCQSTSKDLNEELKPFFEVLETFVAMNTLAFQMNAMIESKNKKKGGGGGDQKQKVSSVSKWWADYNDLKKKFTDIQRKLDELLNPVYSGEVLNATTSELSELYLFG